MRRKWYRNRFGIEELDVSREFVPSNENYRAFDLRAYGIATVSVIGRAVSQFPDAPSPWHVHRKHIELIYCQAGSCDYESLGKKYRLMPGLMFVSRPNEEHRQLNLPNGLKTYFLQFRPDADPAFRWLGDRLRKLPRLVRCPRSVGVRFGKILALLKGKKPDVEKRVRLQTETQALLLDVVDAAAGKVSTASVAFEELAREMREHPEKTFPLEGLVARSGVSRASFVAAFKAAHGYPPHAYLLRCRVEKAKSLLSRELTESDVAERLGFPTRQHFTRTFRNFVGVSPTVWKASRRI